MKQQNPDMPQRQLSWEEAKQFMGNNECNRTVCNNMNAVCWNTSTRAFYCVSCAQMINRECDRFGDERVCQIPLEGSMNFPEDMLIPEMRKDVSKPENVRWLLRNISIQNRNHPELSRVIEELMALVHKEK